MAKDDFEEEEILLDEDDADSESDEDDEDLDLELDEDLGLDDIVVGDDEDDDLELDDDDEDEDDDDEEEAATGEEAEESLDVLLAREVGEDETIARLDDEPRDGLVSVTTPIGADEFTCTSCFLVKRRAQLADEKRMICFDCA